MLISDPIDRVNVAIDAVRFGKDPSIGHEASLDQENFGVGVPLDRVNGRADARRQRKHLKRGCVALDVGTEGFEHTAALPQFDWFGYHAHLQASLLKLAVQSFQKCGLAGSDDAVETHHQWAFLLRTKLSWR